MATVVDMIQLYRAMTALLGPLEGALGRAWQSIGTGGFAVIPDFFGEFTNSISGGNIAEPRLAAGYNGFGGLGAFNQAIGLPERPVRSGNGGFYYTGFGDKGASGGTGLTGGTGGTGGIGRTGEWGLNFFPEKIRGGNGGSYPAGGGFVFPYYGADLGMVLDKQLTGKRISGTGADVGYSGYFDFSGEYGEYSEYCDPGASGENRGSLYMNREPRRCRTHRTHRSDLTFRSLFLSGDPENVLVPNARSEVFDLWKNTEYPRIADHLKTSDDIASGERAAAVRGFAGREEGGGYSGSGGYCNSKINIDMSSMKNIVNSKSDMDELIDRLCGAISEAAFSMAEGVHS